MKKTTLFIRRSFSVGGLTLLIACLPFTLCFGQAGSLDLSFDTDGKVTTPMGFSNDYAHAVAIQADGKIIVAGQGGPDFALARYNTNGSLDNTFDTDGKVFTDFGGSGDAAYAVAVQSDGKIVAAGYYGTFPNYDFAVARYNTNGSLDNTFDGDGRAMISVGANPDQGKALIIQPDGKIIVAGMTSNGTYNDIAIIRLNTNGSLDNTFDTDGRVITPIGTANDIARSLALQSDGKILTTGYSFSSSSTDYDICVLRYNTNGSLDNTFDGDGIRLIDAVANSNDYGETVLVQTDGKIVIGAYSFTGNITMVRLNANGSNDATFATNGINTMAFGAQYSNPYAAVLQSDGRILMGGYSITSGGPSVDFALVRYNSNGTIDNSFDTDGIVYTDIDSTDFGTAIAIQSDGKIVLAGRSLVGSNYDFSVVRYNNVITGIGPDLTSAGIHVYPNPSNGRFDIDGTNEGDELTIYNMLGAVVHHQIIESSNHQTTIAGAGVYFLQVKTGEGVVTRKLIVE